MSETAHSIRQLAKAMSVSRTAVSKWLLHPTWPFPATLKAGVSVEAVQQWRATLPGSPANRVPEEEDEAFDFEEEEQAGGEGKLDIERHRRNLKRLTPVQQARYLKLRVEIDRIKRQNSIMEGLYIEKAGAQADLAGLVHNWKSASLAEARSSSDAAVALGIIDDGKKNELSRMLLERQEAHFHRLADGVKELLERDSLDKRS